MPADYKETPSTSILLQNYKQGCCAIKQHPEHSYDVSQQGFMKHLPYVSAAKRKAFP